MDIVIYVLAAVLLLVLILFALKVQRKTRDGRLAISFDAKDRKLHYHETLKSFTFKHDSLGIRLVSYGNIEIVIKSVEMKTACFTVCYNTTSAFQLA